MALRDPNCLAHLAHGVSARSHMSLEASDQLLRSSWAFLPPSTLALAASSPAIVLSRMISRSNSAIEANTWKTEPAPGVCQALPERQELDPRLLRPLTSSISSEGDRSSRASTSPRRPLGAGGRVLIASSTLANLHDQHRLMPMTTVWFWAQFAR